MKKVTRKNLLLHDIQISLDAPVYCDVHLTVTDYQQNKRFCNSAHWLLTGYLDVGVALKMKADECNLGLIKRLMI